MQRYICRSDQGENTIVYSLELCKINTTVLIARGFHSVCKDLFARFDEVSMYLCRQFFKPLTFNLICQQTNDTYIEKKVSITVSIIIKKFH